MKQEAPLLLNPDDIRTMRKDLKKLKGIKSAPVAALQKPAAPVPPPPPPPPPVKIAIKSPQPSPSLRPPDRIAPPVVAEKSVAQKVSLPNNPPSSLQSALNQKKQVSPQLQATSGIQPPAQPREKGPPSAPKPAPRPKTFMEEVEELANQP